MNTFDLIVALGKSICLAVVIVAGGYLLALASRRFLIFARLLEFLDLGPDSDFEMDAD